MLIGIAQLQKEVGVDLSCLNSITLAGGTAGLPGLAGRGMGEEVGGCGLLVGE